MGHDPQKVNNTDQTASPFDHWFGPRADADSAAAAAATRSARQIIEHDPDLGPMHVTPTCPAPAPAPQRPASDPLAPPEAPSEAEAPGAPDSGPQGPPDQPLAGALTMAARGFRIFPLSPGTKIPPKGLKWKTEATTDAETIRKWAATYPGCNFAVRGGQGLIVLDPDGDAGRAALAELEALHGRLPNTMTVQTPGGGLHIYLGGADVSNSVGSLPKGIDVRGAGGYVVAPGSYFADPGGEKGYTGHYRIETDLPLANAPEWLPGLLKAAPLPKKKSGTRPVHELDQSEDIQRAIRFLQNEATPAIEGKGGDQQTYAVACELRDFGISEDVACELMLERYNPRCSPPWGPEGMAAKVANAFAYAQNHAGCKSVAEEAAAFASAVPLQDTTQQAAEPPLLWASDLFDLPEPDWLIEEIMPEGGVGLLAGQSRIGKSFIALELARCVMTGEPFFGHEVCQRGGVLIAAAEAPETLSGRIKALCNEAHPNGPLNPARLPLVVVPLTGREQLPRLVARTATAMRSKGVRLRLVIVDTIAAGYRVADENDAGQATEAMQHLADGARAFGGFMLGVHHFGKNGASGARGSSAWTASADIILAATGVVDDETGIARDRKLALTKSRNARTKLLSHFEIVDVLTGVRRNGKEARAGLVRLLASNPAQAASRPPKWLEALLDAFEQVDESRVVHYGGQACIPQTYAREIFDDRVRPEFPSASSCRNAWARALKFALETGQLQVADGVPHAFILNRFPLDDR
jgi:hypothetical protein